MFILQRLSFTQWINLHFETKGLEDDCFIVFYIEQNKSAERIGQARKERLKSEASFFDDRKVQRK